MNVHTRFSIKGLREIASLSMRGVEPAVVSADLPTFEWIDPKSLYVEADYQRSLSEHSLTMIRRIVANWRWAHVKPSICVRLQDGRVVLIDGQHTAIAAVSHGGISKIPIMVVTAASMQERAAAFISQNRDRLVLTPMHLHFAAATAGDEIAIAVNEACAKAGVILLKMGRGTRGIYKVGETFSIGIIARFVKRVGVHQGAKMLKVLVNAKRAPVPAQEIAAVGILMFDEKYKGKVDLFDLTTVLRSRTSAEWKALASQKAADGGVPARIALAEVLFTAVSRMEKHVV